MTWLTTLSKTYEKAIKSNDSNNTNYNLLPISHTTQQADVEVTIDMQGNFISATVIEMKDEKDTLIPCTEASANRTGPGAKSRPHPLHDKLQYVAGDYDKFGGSKGTISYEKYMEQLSSWVQSEYSTKEVEAIYQYVSKGILISDLVNEGILFLNDEGKLLDKWPDSDTRPAIFKTINTDQENAFVRFRLRKDDGISFIEPWQNKEMMESFVDFYESSQEDVGLDYATGKKMALTFSHPKKIRHTGDQAKLISANDKSGFTFRGRFDKAEQASQVSYKVSQQAHNALKWLIQEQGERVGERIFLVWGTGGEYVPNPTQGTVEILENPFIKQNNVNKEKFNELYSSLKGFANEFNKSLLGYKSDLAINSNIAIIVLDSATTGRLAVNYYREYLAGETDRYFQSLKSWHERLRWNNLVYSKAMKKSMRLITAPSLRDIALVAFGVQRGDFLDLNEKVISQTIMRLLPVILDENLNIPRDIVHAAYTNACYPQRYSEFNWSKVKGVACSLIKGYRNHRYKEGWTMKIDYDTDDLTYNIGRWVAVLDEIETQALIKENQKKNRATSVERYFSKLADRPCQTVEIVMKQLAPYRSKLGNYGNRLYALEQEIAAKINPEDFAKARNLDGRFLLGFDAQKHAIYQDRKNRREAKEKQDIENLENN